MGFLVVFIFSALMFIGSTVFLNMIRDVYHCKNAYLLPVIHLAILTATYVTNEYINLITLAFICIFAYIANSAFVVLSFYSAFKTFSMDNSDV